MSQINNQNFTMRIMRGLRANLLKVANYFLEGELIYTTNTKHVFISDGSVPNPIQTLDMAVCNNDEIIINLDEIVYTY